MAIHDLYRSSIGSHNTSSRTIREGLNPEQAYYEPEVLMTGPVWVNSGRQPSPLLSQPTAPPKVTAPTLDAQAVAARVSQHVHHLASLESIYVRAKPWGFECWLISNRSTEDERFQLYDIEWQLMETATEIGFKFYLIDRQDRPLAQVLTIEPSDAVVSLLKVQNA